MNVYQACMAAASHIERSPEDFEWHSCSIPSAEDCGTPGCAIGWIGFYLGVERGGTFESVRKILNIDWDMKFYKEMDLASGDNLWQTSAPRTAAALRAYAAKYHAPAVPKRTDAELVADLMAKVTSGERIPEDA